MKTINKDKNEPWLPVLYFMICVLISFSSCFLQKEKGVVENHDINNLSIQCNPVYV